MSVPPTTSPNRSSDKSPQAVDTKMLRQALGTFATGVTVVTTGGPEPHGMTANSFTSVSLDPALVLICVERGAVTHERLLEADHFGISVLAADQENLARHFANRWRPLGLAQFEGIAWSPGQHTGVPLLDGAIAHFECQTWRRYDGGDHTIFLGSPLWLDSRPDGSGLLYFRGRFERLAAREGGVST